MVYPVCHFALLSLLLAIAAASDVAHHRISNQLAVAVVVGGLASQAATHGIGSAASGVAAAVVVGVLLWPAWTCRMIGGGDLKLAAAAAAWVGLARVPTYLLAAAITAGAMASVAFAASSLRARSEIRSNLLALALGTRSASVSLVEERGRVVVPAGAAFAVGSLVALAVGGAP